MLMAFARLRRFWRPLRRSASRLASTDPPGKEKVRRPLLHQLDASAGLNADRELGPNETEFATPLYPENLQREANRERRESSASASFIADGRDDSENFVFLFPGQGGQKVGMGAKWASGDEGDQVANAVKPLYERASQILGYDLLKLCTDGPQSELDKTVHCQPAVVVTSLAAVERLFLDKPEAVERCVSAAGFSVGEITALIFSGALTFDEGIRLVKLRAEAMQLCSDAGDANGMMTVFYGKNANLGLACEAARKWVQKHHGVDMPVCQVANFLYQGAKVIAGHKLALDFIRENKSDFGIRKSQPLPVSGAFHTPLMADAQYILRQHLRGGAAKVHNPRIPVYSNIDKVYRTADHVRKTLPVQVTKQVRWEQSMNVMFSPQRYPDISLYPTVYECGPGDGALCAMLKKINGKAGKRAFYVDVL